MKMHHFVAGNNAEPLKFSNRLQISGQICQYFKPFQLEALRFLYKHYEGRDSCILNDESGLGKCAVISVFLGAILENNKKDKCLIIVQTDADIVGWQYHLNVLSQHLTVQVITEDSDCNAVDTNLFLAKWNTLNSIGDLSRFDFNYIIIDNRGQILNNNFCLAMLLKYYEKKVNIFISSVDITSDLKLFYNALRLCGRLEHQYSSWKLFEQKFKLPDAKDVSSKNACLEEYFLKREILIDYCKDFRLRRFRHQVEELLPLVDGVRYKNNLETWRTKFNSKETSTAITESIVEVPNTTTEKNTEELFEQYIQLKQDEHLNEEIIFITNITKQVNDSDCVEVIDTPVIMSPLLFVESGEESEGEAHCTNSIIEIINVEDSEEKLPTDNKQEKNKSNDITNSNKSDLDKSTKSKQHLRKSERPKKFNGVSKKFEFIVDNVSEKALRNRCINIVEDRNMRQRNTKRKDSNPEKTQTTIQTKKNAEKSKNINQIEIKVTNKSKTRSRINAGQNTEEEKMLQTVKSEGTYDLRNNMDKKIELTSKDTNGIRLRTSKQNKSKTEKEPFNDKKCTKEILNKSNKTSEKTSEEPKSRPCILLRREKSCIETPHTKTICESVNLKNDNVKTTLKINEKATKNTKIRNPAKKTNVNDEKKLAKQETKMDLGKKEVISTPKRGIENCRKDVENTTRAENSLASNKNKFTKNQSKDLNASLSDTPKTNASKSACDKKNCKTPSNRCRELAIAPVGVHSHGTRGMKRATRSFGGSVKSKYMMLGDFSLDIDKKGGLRRSKEHTKSKNNVINANTKKDTLKEKKENNHSSNKKDCIVQSNKNSEKITKNSASNKLSQTSVLPMSDYEEIQCGQKLTPNSNVSSEQNPQIFQKSYDFLIPQTPPSLRNTEYPSFPLNSINIPDSELAIVASKSANTDVILLSSSQDEGSISSVSSLSRRTRVLKRKEVRNKPIIENKCTKPKATFSELLSQQNLRKSAKSPDLFSNCSDVGITCSQVNNKTFEGFKIFGSEVKQFQQQYAKSSTVSAGSSRDRSCLDILEKMFEPRESRETPKKVVQKAKRQSKRVDIVPALPVESTVNNSKQSMVEKLQSRVIPNNPHALEDDTIFEITNNGTFGSMIRINSDGDASPVQQHQQQLKPPQQHNKITNYLIGSTQAAIISSPGENDIHLQRTPRKNTQLSGTANGINCSGTGNGNVTLVHRKSPKSKHSTQNTKLTKWFSKNCTGKAPANEVANEEKGNNSTRKSPIKRRRLELSFQQ